MDCIVWASHVAKTLMTIHPLQFQDPLPKRISSFYAFVFLGGEHQNFSSRANSCQSECISSLWFRHACSTLGWCLYYRFVSIGKRSIDTLSLERTSISNSGPFVFVFDSETLP